MGDVMGTVIFNTCPIPAPSASDFWRGARAAFNLGGSTVHDYHFADNERDAEDAATTNDWAAVNEDLRSALKKAIR